MSEATAPARESEQDTGQPEDAGPKPFSAWLAEQRGGALHSDLSEELQELVAAVVEYQKAGELTLKVKVKANEDGVTVSVSDEVKAKLPTPDKPPSLFYPDDRGNLSRRDPRQAELPLREVPKPKPAAPKEV